MNRLRRMVQIADRLNLWRFVNDGSALVIAILLLVVWLVSGCGGDKNLKEIEADLYDELAESAIETCENGDGKTAERISDDGKPWEELTRDVWQRTYYTHGGLFFMPKGDIADADIVCEYEGPLPVYLCDTGWDPGECASERSSMGCAPPGWTLGQAQRAQWADCNERL